MKTKVLITGGDGFIGSHISRLLINQHSVSIFTLKLDEKLISDFESEIQLFEGDITDGKRVSEVVNSVKPDVIVHLIAFSLGDKGVAKSVELNPDTAFHVNVTGTYHLFQAAAENEVKQMIISSSTTVYPTKKHSNEEVVDESSNNAASNLYGLTKQMTEKMADYFSMHHKIPTLSLRLPMVYGPGRWYKGAGGPFVEIFESASRKEKQAIKGHSHLLDLMYVKDIAFLVKDIIDDSMGVTNVVNVKSHTTSVPEMIETVNQLVGKNLLSFESDKNLPLYPLVSTKVAEETLSYRSRFTVEQACKDFLDTIENKAVK